jgi:hypothetical protein
MARRASVDDQRSLSAQADDCCCDESEITRELKKAMQVSYNKLVTMMSIGALMMSTFWAWAPQKKHR